jgi:Do/DeqQ family serine protease
MKAIHSLRFRALVAVLFVTFCAAGAADEKTASALPPPVLKIDNAPLVDAHSAGLVMSYADVVEPVQQAVVSVYSTRVIPERLTNQRGSGFPAPTEDGLGSGVIVSPNGYILTNNHVVADADELKVSLNDGRELKATVIGTDEKTDIAIIHIEADHLPVVTLADSDKLRVGDVVFAIGNPLEVGQTVTMGIISAKGRTNLGLIDGNGYEDFLQTDAAINMGNSGGALIDAKGRLVGINSAIITGGNPQSEGNIGIGFAIPINLAAGIMHSLVENHGKVVRGYLGVQADTLTTTSSETFKLPPDLKGVLVAEVPADGPAAKAGLRRNDVILSIGGHPIPTVQELRLTVSQMAPGTAVDVQMLRDGKPSSVQVTLAVLPDTNDDKDQILPGVTVHAIDEEYRQRFNLDDAAAGLLIVDVAQNSAYGRYLRMGVVILSINNTPVTEVDAAKKLLHKGSNDFSTISIFGRRGGSGGGQTRDITVDVR